MLSCVCQSLRFASCNLEELGREDGDTRAWIAKVELGGGLSPILLIPWSVSTVAYIRRGVCTCWLFYRFLLLFLNSVITCIYLMYKGLRFLGSCSCFFTCGSHGPLSSTKAIARRIQKELFNVKWTSILRWRFSYMCLLCKYLSTISSYVALIIPVDKLNRKSHSPSDLHTNRPSIWIDSN